MTKRKYLCDVPECGEEIPEGRGTQGGLPICDRCRSALYYARSEGSEWLEHRRTRLAFLSVRAEYLEGHVGKIVRAAKQRASAAVQRAREARAH